jgi:NADH dehydrogenase/NADH:ubiquinone oxidoreductase subunit G
MTMSAPDTERNTLTLDGEEITFSSGETLFEITVRHQKDVPTLCYDKRLEPFGGCRMCVVEVEGSNNPVASCTTMATPGMVVTTKPAWLRISGTD